MAQLPRVETLTSAATRAADWAYSAYEQSGWTDEHQIRRRPRNPNVGAQSFMLLVSSNHCSTALCIDGVRSPSDAGGGPVHVDGLSAIRINPPRSDVNVVDRPARVSNSQVHQSAVSSARPRTWVEVDLAAVRHNTAVLTPPDSALLVMVKGNAYGHGAVEVARTVLAAGAQWLGVSFVEEAIDLRSASLAAPILVTTETTPGDEERALRTGLDLTVYSFAAIDRVAEAGRRTGTTPRVHIKLNTGLNRVGAAPEQASALADHAVANGLDVRGVWTHFAVAEQAGNPATEAQLNRMLMATETIQSVRRCDLWLHAANTAAILAYPQAHLDMVRAGIGIYGCLPDHGLPRAGEIEPTLTWRTSVSHVKRLDAGQGVSYGFTARTTAPTTVATVPVGFADGYPRCLSNRAHVLIRGHRFPVMGTIAMDQMLIDCGDQPIEVGDEVTLIGAQGAQVLTVDELAELAGTIVDEILCGIHPRVPRHYVN